MVSRARHLSRSAARAATLLLAGLASSGVAGALAAPPRIALTPSTVHRGGSIRVHGTLSGCPVGDQVTLLSRAFPATHRFAGVPAVYARVGRGGAYSVGIRIPAARAPGRYSVSGRCGGGNLGVSVTLHVLA